MRERRCDTSFWFLWFFTLDFLFFDFFFGLSLINSLKFQEFRNYCFISNVVLSNNFGVNPDDSVFVVFQVIYCVQNLLDCLHSVLVEKCAFNIVVFS